MKNVLFFANLGFSIIVPLVGSIYLSIYLQNKYDLPSYVVMIGIFLGLFMGIYSFCRSASKGDK